MLKHTFRPKALILSQGACISSDESNSIHSIDEALKNGWQINEAELCPSWDQYGFIYVVTLENQAQMHTYQIILPKIALVDRLLATHRNRPASPHNGSHPLAI